MNMLSGAKYLKDGHPVMVDKDGGYKIYKNKFVKFMYQIFAYTLLF